MSCKFCEAYNRYKYVDDFKERFDLEHGETDKVIREYTVAIVVHGWFKSKGKKSAGRSTDYRYRGLGYKLNFCPECGKKLK